MKKINSIILLLALASLNSSAAPVATSKTNVNVNRLRSLAAQLKNKAVKTNAEKKELYDAFNAVYYPSGTKLGSKPTRSNQDKALKALQEAGYTPESLADEVRGSVPAGTKPRELTAEIEKAGKPGLLYKQVISIDTPGAPGDLTSDLNKLEPKVIADALKRLLTARRQMRTESEVEEIGIMDPLTGEKNKDVVDLHNQIRDYNNILYAIAEARNDATRLKRILNNKNVKKLLSENDKKFIEQLQRNAEEKGGKKTGPGWLSSLKEILTEFNPENEAVTKNLTGDYTVDATKITSAGQLIYLVPHSGNVDKFANDLASGVENADEANKIISYLKSLITIAMRDNPKNVLNINALLDQAKSSAIEILKKSVSTKKVPKKELRLAGAEEVAWKDIDDHIRLLASAQKSFGDLTRWIDVANGLLKHYKALPEYKRIQADRLNDKIEDAKKALAKLKPAPKPTGPKPAAGGGAEDKYKADVDAAVAKFNAEKDNVAAAKQLTDLTDRLGRAEGDEGDKLTAIAQGLVKAAEKRSSDKAIAAGIQSLSGLLG